MQIIQKFIPIHLVAHQLLEIVSLSGAYVRNWEPGRTQETLIELMCPRKLGNFSAYIHAKKIYAGKFQCVQLRYSQDLQSYLIAVGFYSAFSELSCM